MVLDTTITADTATRSDPHAGALAARASMKRRSPRLPVVSPLIAPRRRMTSGAAAGVEGLDDFADD